MSVGSKKQTVGYKYYLGAHIGLCHGPIDAIAEIQVDSRVAWTGASDGTSITISAPELFGGEKREGGVSGVVDIEMGEQSQVPNAYLQSQLGSSIPAFRGVAMAVLNQCYMGNNPYLKPWKFKAYRVKATSDGSEQWYLGAAQISRPDCWQCDELESYLTQLIGSDAAALNMVTDATTALSFPIATGSHDVTTTNFASFGTLVTPDVALGNPCVEGDWARVTLVDTFDEQLIPAALHFPTTDNTFKIHCAMLIINDPDYVGDPITGSSSNIVSPVLPRNQAVRVTFSNGTTVVPQGSGTTGMVSDIGLRRNGDSLEVLYHRQGSLTTPPLLTDSIGTPFYTVVTTLTIPSDAWEDWMVISVSIDPSFAGQLNVGQNLIWFDMSAGNWALEIAYNANAGNAGPRETVTQKVDGASFPLTTHMTSYFHTYSGGTRTLTSMSKEDGAYSVLDNSQCLLAGLYTDNEHIDALPLLNAFLENFENADGFSSGCSTCQDMNPAHIIRECLTNAAWGMGYVAADVDDTSFTAAALTLFNERMGISILWEREQPIEDFIGEILRHIDGVLYVSRDTGKFVLKLIREETPTLTLDESNISDISSAKRPTISELTNAVSVVYWNPDSDEDESLTIHNDALRQIQGVEISTTVQYPGIASRDLAARLCSRDLKALSTPLLSCSITANREAATLNVGDVFTLDWPDLSITSSVMRVNEIDYGDGVDNAVRISAVEDVFSTPALTPVGAPADVWVDPFAADPLDTIARVVEETPYYLLVQEIGELQATDILTADNSAGFLLASGGRQANELNANVYVDAGAGFVDSATLDFHPYALVTAGVGITDTVISINTGKDLDLVNIGDLAQIGNELLRVDSVNVDGGGVIVSVTVGRGVLDTVPQAHPIASPSTTYISFIGGFAVSDNEQYAAAEEIDVKLRTTVSNSILPEASATTETVTMNSRAIRPYPPGDLKIDSVSYPDPLASPQPFWSADHVITWAHRDRTQQTDGNLYDYADAGIGPESGTTYRIDVYSTLTDTTETAPWWTANVGSVNTYTMGTESPAIPSPPANTEIVNIKVTAVRGGYDSWQSPVATLAPTP